MKRDINEWEFVDAFRNMDRENQFSIKGLRALYNHLIDYEESCETEIELDVIALCCEYTEYTLKDYIREYSPDVDRRDYDTQEDFEAGVLEFIRDNTQLIEIEDSDDFIIQQY